ncbi:MAG: DUF433 domain-containing protein [Lewinellaceae bacterium]|nr:DUF433 domain-containing protein [Lewinellaceae bacterium]
MQLNEFIEVDPKVMVGKPVIRGTRITVEQILEDMAAGDTIEDILEAYPRLTREHILAALAYVVQTLKNELVIQVAA